MTRGTLFYYESDDKVWSSCEYNGDMYHGTKRNPKGIGAEVIELMQNLNSLDDFKKVLKIINKKHYQYEEGNKCWLIDSKAIEKRVKSTIKWIDDIRPELKGDKSLDPRAWDKTPTFKDVRTWKFWGVPNLSDYSYIYNNSGNDLIMITRENDEELIIPDKTLGILNYGCKEEEIIPMRVKFNACCIATYKGELELPNNIDTTNKKEVLDYILSHLNDVPCEELEYIGDTDEPVTEDDIYYIGE